MFHGEYTIQQTKHKCTPWPVSVEGKLQQMFKSSSFQIWKKSRMMLNIPCKCVDELSEQGKILTSSALSSRKKGKGKSEWVSG